MKEIPKQVEKDKELMDGKPFINAMITFAGKCFDVQAIDKEVAYDLIQDELLKVCTDVEGIIQATRREERKKIIELFKHINDTKWPDAKHCSCLNFAIDHLEHPEEYADDDWPCKEHFTESGIKHDEKKD